jgi:hypothetical protein
MRKDHRYRPFGDTPVTHTGRKQAQFSSRCLQAPVLDRGPNMAPREADRPSQLQHAKPVATCGGERQMEAAREGARGFPRRLTPPAADSFRPPAGLSIPRTPGRRRPDGGMAQPEGRGRTVRKPSALGSVRGVSGRSICGSGSDGYSEASFNGEPRLTIQSSMLDQMRTASGSPFFRACASALRKRASISSITAARSSQP